jgi:hypothetical protein
MTPKVLTEVQELEVAARYKAGLTERQLAERFGVPRASIQRALDRQQVPRRAQSSNLTRRDDVDTAEIRRLRDEEGLSWFWIARRVGMKPGGVRRRYENKGRHRA